MKAKYVIFIFENYDIRDQKILDIKKARKKDCIGFDDSIRNCERVSPLRTRRAAFTVIHYCYQISTKKWAEDRGVDATTGVAELQKPEKAPPVSRRIKRRYQTRVSYVLKYLRIASWGPLASRNIRSSIARS